MIRAWVAKHRSLAISATSGVVVAALVATAAIVSGGYEAQRLDLGDGSVWVANGERQVIGRANTEILALDTVVATAGSDIDVVQDGATVLLVDRGNSRLDLVDTATAESVESVALPAASPSVHLAGDRTVIHEPASGEVWITPVSAIGDFDPAADPTLSIGADSAVDVQPDGTIYLYSADAAAVYRIDPGITAASVDGVQQTWDAAIGEPGDDVTITAVGDTWVLLDRDTGTLSIGGTETDLSGLIDPTGGAVLQRASGAGTRVLIAHDGGLIGVDLDGGTPEVLVTDTAGAPAAPVVIDGCSYAAWSSGAAWRSCGERAAVTEFDLEGMAGEAARLTLGVNRDRVVLNDARTGGTWAVQGDGESISNWDELILAEQDEQEVEEGADETPPDYEREQAPPVAVDDQFGARPGRSSILPVLLNDYDPNGDVLVIGAVDPIDESVGRLDIIDSGQSVQLTLAQGAAGTVSFGYTVSDGRGGEASATVTATVREPGENAAPEQRRSVRATVVAGASVSTSVLGGWVDPDGDAFYLAAAGTPDPDRVTFTPEGIVVFQHGGATGDTDQNRAVSLAVSDGTATGAGTLTVAVRPAGAAPIIAEPFVVATYAGQVVTIEPLVHVRGGSGTVRLTSVPEKPGSTIVASPSTGTFTFTSDQVRTHYLDYVVGDVDGDQTATGVIRVDVAEPPSANTTPITVPKTVFVQSLSSEVVDVASRDIDPAGGVLLLTQVDPGDPSTGVRADILEQRSVRITLTAPLADGQVTVGYRVSNGLAEADGTITVVEIPPPDRLQPPVASPDSVTVRPGDAIDIAVLANDEHPDGADLTIDPQLVTGLTSGTGLLFVSGNRLRYLAPDRTGNFTAVYRVTGPDGQADQAQVSIAVREAVLEANTAPVPTPIVARVTAGETVRIAVPLTGIDPDGDSVQLLGQQSSPEKGSVTEVGVDFIDYLAGDYSAGTDTFDYTVVDSLGARATGTVRVGIVQRADDTRNPVAVDDEVTSRPGTTVSIRALANDSDPDGSPIQIVSVEPNSADIAATISDDVVEVTPPATPGRYGLVYTIENRLGATSAAFITVIVDPDAPRAYPAASDTVLTLSDIAGRDTVTVDVLRNVFFADGDVASLGLRVLPSFADSAMVTANKRITIPVTERRQIVPFAVSHPDDAAIVSYAFVWVPGSDDALPQVDRTVRPLTVQSGQPLTIDLTERVIAADDREVRLADRTTVRATQSDGSALVVDDQTLRYTAAAGYFGPASISFEVTDGDSATDPDGRFATLVLPITVVPGDNQPPVFGGGLIEFQPGESRTIDLLRLTTYPYPDDLDELRFTAVSTPPEGFDYTITGSTLRITADADISQGTRTALTISVRDDVAVGASGRIRLSVVPSTRPIAAPAPDVVTVTRGGTATVDVLANDEAANPFPGSPLRVVGIGTPDGVSLPAGVRVTPGADRSTLTVTASAAAEAIDTTLQYQVADVTGDPARYAYGTVRISVQDRPDAPIAPVAATAGYQEGELILRITPPLANNSPITRYEIVSTSNGGFRFDCGTNPVCELSGLTPGLPYEFRAIAVNAIGSSTPSSASAPLTADFLPAAPGSVTAVAAGGNRASPQLTVSWSGVASPDGGSAITGYSVRITGPGVDFETAVAASSRSLTTTAGGALAANRQYVATVWARNSAPVGAADWRRTSSAPATTIGAPGAVAGGVTAAAIGTTGNIQVTWGASDPNGASGVRYTIGRFADGAAIPTICATGGSNPGTGDGSSSAVSSGWVDTRTTDGVAYRYAVYADNGLYCTVSASGAVDSLTAPGQATVGTVLAPRGGQWDLQVASLSVASGTAVRYEARLNGAGDWFAVQPGQWLTSAANLGVYGTAQSVVVRGCRDAGSLLCGPASAPAVETPANARGSIAGCISGSVPNANRPVNNDVRSVEYLYSFNDGRLLLDEWTEYQTNGVAPDPAALGTGTTLVRLKTRVTLGNGATFEDPGYAQSSCAQRVQPELPQEPEPTQPGEPAPPTEPTGPE
ncbi:Ig-like domain-containing protein [Marisediminicola senii]|uniref:Ig-like domain-containing protein n=1 Tax=Marisediminicola senii TaxID=2711233 RepID=UPI0013EAB1E9|nr:Ig-like domain-containing protein [Marisediminicola senii]